MHPTLGNFAASELNIESKTHDPGRIFQRLHKGSIALHLLICRNIHARQWDLLPTFTLGPGITPLPYLYFMYILLIIYAPIFTDTHVFDLGETNMNRINRYPFRMRAETVMLSFKFIHIVIYVSLFYRLRGNFSVASSRENGFYFPCRGGQVSPFHTQGVERV